MQRDLMDAYSHRRWHREDGAAAVEFAIVTVLLLLIVFGILEYGRIYSQVEVLNGAAREGARVGAVQGTKSDITDAVMASAGPYSDQISNLTVTAKSESGATAPGAQDPPCQDASSSPSVVTQGGEVTVSFDYHAKVNVGLLPPLDETISIQGVFRCE
ncbi:MAG TPA: TadE/TadG family type IV pilus assembly protein [Actinomycetota bacterium]